jgi:hypothetical protein
MLFGNAVFEFVIGDCGFSILYTNPKSAIINLKLNKSSFANNYKPGI